MAQRKITRFAENALFINMAIFGGMPEEKVHAAAQAGFQQIELWHQDVRQPRCDATGGAQLREKQHLALTDYQLLLDFDGTPDRSKQAAKH